MSEACAINWNLYQNLMIIFEVGRPLGAAAKAAVVLDGGGKPPPYRKYKCKPFQFTAKFQFIGGLYKTKSQPNEVVVIWKGHSPAGERFGAQPPQRGGT